MMYVPLNLHYHIEQITHISSILDPINEKESKRGEERLRSIKESRTTYLERAQQSLSFVGATNGKRSQATAGDIAAQMRRGEGLEHRSESSIRINNIRAKNIEKEA